MRQLCVLAVILAVPTVAHAQLIQRMPGEYPSIASRTRACPAGTTCKQLAFDTGCDLALASTATGVQPAVARDVLASHVAYHAASNVNDGEYGNGSAWVSGAAGSWVKIDLGKPTAFNAIRLGRDRLGTYDDRDPGQLAIYTSVDGTTETKVWEGPVSGDGKLDGRETVLYNLLAQNARYVKLVFAAAGVAVDEIEVHNLEDLDGGAQGPGCRMVNRVGVVRLQPSTWSEVIAHPPAAGLVLRLNWWFGADGPEAASNKWLGFGNPTDAVISSFQVVAKAGVGPVLAEPDGRVVRWSRSLLGSFDASSAAGEEVTLGATGLTLGPKNFPACLVPLSGTAYLRPAPQFPGNVCPAGPGGKLAIEPWVLAPF